MKWIVYLILAALCAGGWVMYSRKGAEMGALQKKIELVEDDNDPKNEVPAMRASLNSLEGEKILSGVLLTFLTAGLIGILFVFHILPAFANKMTNSVFNSGEMVEKDVMREGRAFLAQGDYEGAIAAFQQAATEEPLNRMPWVEIVKIYKDQFEDVPSAIQVLRSALESQQWPPGDAVFFLFRLSELYHEQGDMASATAIMQQVMDEFPNTRHSANAAHTMKEWEKELQPV